MADPWEGGELAARIRRAQDRFVRRDCPQCGRVFDMTDETDAEEWSYGHDCVPLDAPAPRDQT